MLVNQDGMMPEGTQPKPNGDVDPLKSDAQKMVDLSSATLPSRVVANSADKINASADPKSNQFTFEHYTSTNLPSAETARQVADLFVAVYGGIHNRDILKNPEHYRDEVQRGELIPFIVRDAAGKIVAHTGIMSLANRAVEIGFQLADPAVRGQSLGATLRDQALAHIEKLVAEGVIDTVRAECVTAHPATQKYAARANFIVTGILDRKFYDMFETNRDETFVRLEFLRNPEIKKARTVFLPGSMFVISDNIFKQLDCIRCIKMSPLSAIDTPVGPAEVSKETHELTAWDALVLEVSPGVTPFQLAQEMHKEFNNGVRHLSVRVNISHPAAIDQINALRGLGFYFGAIEPVRERDYLLMQRRQKEDGTLCAPGEINLYDEDARILVNLIRSTQLH